VNELPGRLALQTAFETPVPSLPVPATLTAGNRPELLVVDKMARGVALLGRYGATPALFGLKVCPGAGTVRVSVQFGLDKTSTDWWEARAPEHLTNRDAARGRLFLVRSQGATRAAVYLVRRVQDAEGVTRGEARFDLSADELDEAGLLIVEVQGVDQVPLWAQQQLTPFAPIGVRIESVDLSPVDDHAAPLVHQLSVGGFPSARSPSLASPASSAGPPAQEAPGSPPLPAPLEAVAMRSDLFVASPGAPAPARWTLRVRLNRPLGPTPVDPDGSHDPTLGERLAWPMPAVAATGVTCPAHDPAASARAFLGPTDVARSIARILLGRRGRSNRVAGAAAPKLAPRSRTMKADLEVDAVMSLTEMLEDLLGRNCFRVEAVGLSGIWLPEPSIVVRSVEDAACVATPSTSVVTELAEVDLDLGEFLPEPVLIGALFDQVAMRAMPGFDHASLSWELLVPTG